MMHCLLLQPTWYFPRQFISLEREIRKASKDSIHSCQRKSDRMRGVYSRLQETTVTECFYSMSSQGRQALGEGVTNALLHRLKNRFQSVSVLTKVINENSLQLNRAVGLLMLNGDVAHHTAGVRVRI
eukprot:TRINITY_DN1166_c0_g2_i1.p2 TRINITY_DN1166_c0_g2~~TRINITY_DN1166_c0_g2_i1.p2  ORF type:complete len:127 (-),score=10.73 TRINITY_DN1166_c0_g2_i1:8316-8696(-)